MKQDAFFLIMGLLASVNAFAGAVEIRADSVPAWVNSDFAGIESPERMSGAEQEQCTQVILNEINKRTHLSFNDEDVAQIRMPGWPRAERGFIRGGGFNIRIATTLKDSSKRLRRLHAGRFADMMTWLKMGDEPSLHLPENIGGQKSFFRAEGPVGTHVDFVAHVDTGYAFLPIGLIVHFISDVVGADRRNPCPSVPEGDLD